VISKFKKKLKLKVKAHFGNVSEKKPFVYDTFRINQKQVFIDNIELMKTMIKTGNEFFLQQTYSAISKNEQTGSRESLPSQFPPGSNSGHPSELDNGSSSGHRRTFSDQVINY